MALQIALSLVPRPGSVRLYIERETVRLSLFLRGRNRERVCARLGLYIVIARMCCNISNEQYFKHTCAVRSI